MAVINNSEEIVKEYLEKRGWSVSNHALNQNGFDLLATKNKKFLIIEVKSLCLVNNEFWRIRSISERAKQSDILAIVFPNNHIHFEYMKDHLCVINSEGDRYLTTLVDLYGSGSGDG